MRANGCGWIDGKYVKPPKKYKIRATELDCIDMINSILAYNCSGCTDAEKVMEYEEKSWHNYLADYVKELGRVKVVALIQEQINSIDHVDHSVYTDSEGCVYNSIAWKEVS
jgi:hypothetical protein